MAETFSDRNHHIWRYGCVVVWKEKKKENTVLNPKYDLEKMDNHSSSLSLTFLASDD